MKEENTNPNKPSSLRYFIASGLIIICVYFLWILVWEPKPDPISEAIISKAAAQKLGKDPNDLTYEDFAKITELYIIDNRLRNIKLLEKFKNLQELSIDMYPDFENDNPKWKVILAKMKLYNLSTKNNINFNPLINLPNLQKLKLENIHFYDIKQLSKLKNMKELEIRNSNITGLYPLKKLINLQKLTIYGSEVYNIKPLETLINLQFLDIGFTEVNDLEPLKGLKNLETLSLSGSRVSDLEPIKGLTNLKNLELFDTRVSDLEPIKGLINLGYLGLNYIAVSSIEPIKSLITLKSIDICQSTNITDEQQQELQKYLPNLKFDFYYGGGPYTPRN